MIHAGFDCEKLLGRERQICEGTSGLPETGPGHTRAAYIELWKRRELGYPPREPVGLGDVVEAIVRFLTFGLLTTAGECTPCGQRKFWLNEKCPRVWPPLPPVWLLAAYRRLQGRPKEPQPAADIGGDPICGAVHAGEPQNQGGGDERL